MGRLKNCLVAFTLTMPGKGSWDGKWSGEGKLYCKIKIVSINHPLFHKEMPLTFRYRWDDGWEAEVRAEVVDGNKARRLRKASAGFCRYDWMVDSILRYGEIKVDILTYRCPTCGAYLNVRRSDDNPVVSTWCFACQKMIDIGKEQHAEIPEPERNQEATQSGNSTSATL